MRAVILSLLTLALFTGCDAGPSIDGEWASEWRTDSDSGALALQLTPDGHYVSWDATMTGAATADAEIELGIYAAIGDRITFTPATSSCSTKEPHSLPYSVAELTLTTPEAVFERRAQSPFVGVAIRPGCADTGAFVPQPIQ